MNEVIKKLYENDYVVLNKKTNELLKFSCGDVVIYGDMEVAIKDSTSDEIVISCTKLSKELQDQILEQINKG